jgi:hypothetical protein
MPKKTTTGFTGTPLSWKPFAAIAYVAVAFLTFGHVFNANYVPPRDCGARPSIVNQYENYETWYDCEFGEPRPTHAFTVGYPAFFIGAFWPAYWAGKAAIEVTR